MATGYYCVRTPWNTALAIDEFGAGTLDGNLVDGPSYDACGPAALENGCAAYERRLPLYANIGRIRRDLIENGQWTQPAELHNPRSGGCLLEHLAWEVGRLNWGAGRYQVAAELPAQDATLSAQQIRDALHYEAYAVVMVYDAAALMGNEQGVARHFIGIPGYGGDAGTPSQSGGTDEHGYGKVYILNSDVAGQHGIATGQWLWIDELLKADPRGYLVLAQAPPVTPLDVAGAISDLEAALKKLGSVNT